MAEVVSLAHTPPAVVSPDLVVALGPMTRLVLDIARCLAVLPTDRLPPRPPPLFLLLRI